MRKLNINLPTKKIPIYIGSNIFKDFTQFCKKQEIENNIFLLVDNSVYRNFKQEIEFVKQQFPRVLVDKIKANEKVKSQEGLARIYKRLVANKFGRDTTLVAIGGGIIGDLGGFAAATFSRGIKLVHVPTTLLAMVDSSIGGKTGINFGGVKNIVGAFYQPEFIFFDLNFLTSLGREEIISGLGEVVKYAFLTDEKFFNYVEKNLEKILSKDLSVLEKIVTKSVKIKSSVVEQDEKESGLRKILNLGHTFGHAYESASGYKLAHGKAVLAGIHSAINLSLSKGLAEKSLLNKYEKLLTLLLKNDFPPFNYNLNILYSLMKNDKKNREGKIKFVLPIEFGNVALDIEATQKEIRTAIKSTINFFGEIAHR